MHDMKRYDADLPNRCAHGTYWRHYDRNLAEGLRAGGCERDRAHIYFAASEPGDSDFPDGMRKDCDVAV